MTPRLNPAALRRRQNGVVLFIALIVLVAMTLAGLAIMRSVDTGNLVSGNVAFRQTTLASSDNGINTAFNWLTANIVTGTLNADSPSNGYFSVVSDPPDWTDSSYWSANGRIVGTDAAGNTVSYVIHRMCAGAGPYNNTSCAQSPRSGGAAGNSQGVGGNAFTATPVVFYRVTVYVQGPRSTVSVVQSTIGLQM